MLFMVRYLQEVQGPKHVVGRDFAYIAATPEARRLFLATARHLMLQVRQQTWRTPIKTVQRAVPGAVNSIKQCRCRLHTCSCAGSSS